MSLVDEIKAQGRKLSSAIYLPAGSSDAMFYPQQGGTLAVLIPHVELSEAAQLMASPEKTAEVYKLADKLGCSFPAALHVKTWLHTFEFDLIALASELGLIGVDVYSEASTVSPPPTCFSQRG